MTQPYMELNINSQTIGGETPLIKAAEQGSLDVCIALIKAGANPLLVDNLGRNA